MSNSDLAKQRADLPLSAAAVLDRRSLESDFKRLHEILPPGQSVLDVGCGTGAITAGIARAVAPGPVIGLDSGHHLIEQARHAYGDIPNLVFETGDVYRLQYRDRFDIVCAARVLQWLDRPQEALQSMIVAAKPGGRVVVLDYNHEKAVLMPEPPASMLSFRATYLRWRAQAGMDNAIADHLADIFLALGLKDIQVTQQHELAHRADADFAERILLWAEVAASRGKQLVAEGFITEHERNRAEADFRAWAEQRAESQKFYLLCVEGIRPG
jgi:ubiquinone/menaquinone biosynthesis C-methylase UbiE